MKQRDVDSNTVAKADAVDGAGRGSKVVRRAAMLLACALPVLTGFPAFAQTSVDNIARVVNPAGLACSDVATNPTCERSDNALVTVAAVQPDFGSCDATMYLAQNSPTGLFQFDTSNNPFVVDPVGPTSSINYNAIAYNPIDNYIYGLRGPVPGTLIRIGSDGSVEDVGTITNFPTNSVIGEIGPDGTYYTATSTTLYRIDIATRFATAVPLSQAINGQDMAWHDGLLYIAAPNAGQLYAIDPASGNVTPLGSTGVAGNFGGMFGASNGVFGSNNAGGFYQFDLTTGQATLISGLPGSGNNDGAKCVTTPLEFPADLTISKDDGRDSYVPGEDVVYTIVVSNLGPFGVSGATVDDPLPAGISTASWTCSGASGGGTCGVAGGTGPIANVPINLPADATAIFTLTMAVPTDFTGELTNTATVTSPDGSPDPTPGNNTDTDTDTTPAVVIVNKSVSPGSGTAVSVGDTLAYTLTVSVANAVTTDPEVLVDTLGAGLTVDILPAGCTAADQVVTCTLAAGAAIGDHVFEYTAIVDADATTSVSNSVVPGNGTCVTCTTTNPVDPTITVNKSVNPGSGTPVSPGDMLTYTLTVDVANAVSTDPEVLTDTLGAGLTVGTLPAGCTSAGQVVTCTLAPGAAIGQHVFEYTATVDADATTSVSNSVVPSNGTCVTCTTTNPVDPTITVNKSVSPGSGTPVSPGDMLTYTLTVDVANAATTDPEVLTDTLGAGLTVGTLPAGCTSAGQVVTCTLAPGAAIGQHVFEYTATVDADAVTSVSNSVVPSNGTCVTCTTTNPVDPTITVNKSVSPGSGTPVSPGDMLTYTLTVDVANAVSTDPEVLTDTLGAGLTIGTLPAGCSATGQVITCTLAPGAAIGQHVFEYTATVDADAVTSVSNSVVPSTGTCVTCTTTNPVDPTITVNKSVNPGSGTPVSPGDMLTYTLTLDVANAVSTDPEVLTDTLGAGLTIGTLPAGCTSAGQVVTCTLAPGAAIGQHVFEYTATVDADAVTSVSNSVVPSNGTCVICTTTNPVDPTITVNKSVSPGSGTPVSPGDMLTYTLTVDVANAVSIDPEVLTDTLGAGLTIGTLPAGCSAAGQVITCTLAPGAAIGQHVFEYTATVDADATTSVSNSVVPSNGTCVTCTTTNPVDPTITVNKSVNPGSGSAVSVGDTLAYTLTVSVFNAISTDPEVLVDTLGAGLTIDTLPAGCTAAGQVVTCTLAAGATIGDHVFEYTATVEADATTSVSNSVVPSNGTCVTCTTTNPVDPTITVNKDVNPGNGTAVAVGDTLTYTLTVDVTNAATTDPEVLTDTLGTGLTVGILPAGCTSTGQVVTCILAAGAAIGDHVFEYTATVDADAVTSVSNSVVPSNGTCVTCTTTNPVRPRITVDKTVDPASGTAVSVGDSLHYALTIEVANAVTVDPEVLTDTLGAGLTVGTLPAGCSAAGQVITCTLAPGAAIGRHVFEYTATVDADAVTAVSNSVVPSTGTCLTCTTTNPVTPEVTVSKGVVPGDGTAVSVGDTLAYTLTVAVANAATTDPEVLTDTLGTGLTVGTLPAGCSAAGQVVTCTLAAGAAVGEHTFEYTAIVGVDATTAVTNTVVPGSGNCVVCSTSNPVVPLVTVAKASNPASGETVRANDLITYTVTVTVANAATADAIALVDTLTGGQTLLPATIEVPAGGSCDATATGLECTLAPGVAPGQHVFSYQAQVDADAAGSIGNNVVPSGGGSPPDCVACTTEHPIAEPVVNVTKSSDPGSGASLHVGDTIQYTLAVTIADAATTSDLVLEDTPGPGLTLGALPAGCAATGTGLRCVLSQGTVPGSYAFTYPATINADAGGNVSNAVLANGGGGDQNPPTCVSCDTTHKVVDEAQLRVAKAAGVREVRLGDLVRYTLTVENVGATNVRDAAIVDTPPAGFSYVAGSLAVTDGDNAANASGYNPIRFAGLDIDAGKSATLVYLMRVGAGVRPGVLVNQAQGFSSDGDPISNIATAEVTLAADPLIDESLILGTVFDDRDGDGWQDSAAMTGVHVQGGFEVSAYVPGSTTLDRGDGPQPQADASAPLLHGIDLGDIDARQSVADPAERREVVVSQRLVEPRFTDDFVLTTDQGVTLRMDAAGNTTVASEGEAAKGLNAAAPTVTRRIAQGEGGVVVDYVIGNAGIDERGIPGVRIASVDGLLVETDQFGRYHLAGVPGGAWERGRNFILKVDPSTLPPGTQITTDNPLVRRITPGLPVRFDFGAMLPVEVIAGGERQVELELGEVIFEPGSAALRAQYLPMIDQIAARVVEYGGGEVVISADGDSEALAFGRANAVKTALLAKVPAQVAAALSVSVRTAVDDPSTLVAGVGEGGPVLGMVLFDTDSAAIKPAFGPLLDQVAGLLEHRQGGVVAIIGHADRRASDAYNTALGMRRARAVYEALATRLSPEVRSKVRVESSNDPAAPAGSSRGQGMGR